MTGALSVLSVGAVLLNLKGEIMACDEQFARHVGKTILELIGTLASDLARPQDRIGDPWLTQQALQSGQSFTTLTKRASGEPGLYENHVVQLFGGEAPLVLSISRPSSCRQALTPLAGEMVADAANYSADMALQMATIVSKAHMPVTVDLFAAAAAAAVIEGGLNEVEETAA